MGNAAENFSILRRIALNLFRQDRSVKAGVKTCRLLASADVPIGSNGWDYQQLLDAIALGAIRRNSRSITFALAAAVAHLD